MLSGVLYNPFDNCRGINSAHANDIKFTLRRIIFNIVIVNYLNRGVIEYFAFCCEQSVFVTGKVLCFIKIDFLWGEE